MKQTTYSAPLRVLFNSLAIAGLVSLAACGGGGGGSEGSASGGAGGGSTTPPVTNPETQPGTGSGGAGGVTEPVPETLPATTVGSVAAPSYGAASEDQLAFNLLNDERARCGFGKLAQNVQLDVAAKGHADYLIINGKGGHFQSASDPGYTGNSALDRASAAGYTAQGITDENADWFGSSNPSGFGVWSIRSLLAAPYHLAGMVAGYREIGISIRTSNDLGTTMTWGSRVHQQYNLAYKAADGRQEPASNDVLTYPCEGSTGVNYRVTNESPNPVPGRDLLASPIGPGILVAVRTGQTLTVSSATMVTVSGNTPVTLRTTMTKANDPNNTLSDNQALIIPDAALTPSTDYKVTVVGKNGTADFTRTFTFSAGTGG